MTSLNVHSTSKSITPSTPSFNYSFVESSGNRKTGKMPVTSTEQSSCPDSCELKVKGCYAKSGPVLWQWKKLDNAGLDLEQLTYKLKALPVGTLWRHNVAGDLPSNKRGTIIKSVLMELVKANKRRKLKGFTYTHNKLSPANVIMLQNANQNGFTVNVSCDTKEEAVKTFKLHDGLPVVAVLPLDAPNTQFVDGVQVVACPAEKSDKVTCKTCGICAVHDRDYVIGFRAHGNAKKHVSKLADANIIAVG